MPAEVRWLKWVGLPPVRKDDGWRVHNWAYENSRPIALVMPPNHTGRTIRVVEKGTYYPPGQTPITVHDTYAFTQDCEHAPFVTPVPLRDALAIQAMNPHSFVDVTDIPRSEWPYVRHKTIIVDRHGNSSAPQIVTARS